MARFGVDLSAYKTKTISELDAQAEKVRLRFVTPGAGQALAYMTKLMEAEAYLALGDREAVVSPYEFPHLANESAVDGMTYYEKAEQIATIAWQWRMVSSTIDAKRLQVKQLIDAATSASEIRTLMDFEWDDVLANLS